MIETLKEKDYFKSADMALCASLNALGYQIEIIDNSNPSRAVFYIKRDENIDNIIQVFFTHQLRVDPALYFSCLRELKTRLRNKNK